MPSWSGTLALCTLASTSSPSVSTRMWRLRPLTFLPPSKPLCSPPTPVVFTDWASTMPALGSGSRPSFRLKRRRSARFKCLPGSVDAPFPEVVEHRLPGREVSGQHPPLAAALEAVEDGVADLARAVEPRAASPFGGRELGLQQPPFFVGEVGGVPSAVHAAERSRQPTPFSDGLSTHSGE